MRIGLILLMVLASILAAVFKFITNSIPSEIEDLLDSEDFGFFDGTLDLAIIRPETVNTEFEDKRFGRRLAVLTADVLFGYDREMLTLDEALLDKGVPAGLLEDEFYYNPSIIIVPKNYVTDFASIPIWARWLIPPFGEHAEAAIVHDWLYSVGLPNQRKTADLIFYAAMRQDGVSEFRSKLIYSAVRVGGGLGYGDGSRATPWTQSFFESEVDALLPAKCIPERPIDYFQNNLNGCIAFARFMEDSEYYEFKTDKAIRWGTFTYSTSDAFWQPLYEQSSCRDFLAQAAREKVLTSLNEMGLGDYGNKRQLVKIGVDRIVGRIGARFEGTEESEEARHICEVTSIDTDANGVVDVFDLIGHKEDEVSNPAK